MAKILIHAPSAKSGGAETYLRNVVRGLAETAHAHELLLCVPSPLGAELQDRWPHVRILPTEAAHSPLWRRFLCDQLLFRRFVQKERADILVASSDFGLLFPPCPQILLLRNSLHFSPLYLQRFLPRKRWRFRLEFALRRWLSVWTARHSDLVMTASWSMLENARPILALPSQRLAVNPFGVSSEMFKKTEGRGAFRAGPLRLLYVSEYSDYKNLTALLRAVRLLAERPIGDFSLTSTLDPRQFPGTEISSRAEDSGLISDPLIQSHLNLVGPVPYDRIPALYREHDLFVFPSLVESFGHPLVEAMAAGLPIACSDIPVCREICGEAAVYFTPLDPEDVASKILLLRNNNALRRQLAEAGRQRAQTHFSWDDHVRRLLEAMETLLRGRRP